MTPESNDKLLKILENQSAINRLSSVIEVCLLIGLLSVAGIFAMVTSTLASKVAELEAKVEAKK
jgi:hypothetical protein